MPCGAKTRGDGLVVASVSHCAIPPMRAGKQEQDDMIAYTLTACGIVYTGRCWLPSWLDGRWTGLEIKLSMACVWERAVGAK